MMKTFGLLSLQTVLPVNGTMDEDDQQLETNYFDAAPLQFDSSQGMQFDAQGGEQMDHSVGEPVLNDDMGEDLDPLVNDFFKQDATLVQNQIKSILTQMSGAGLVLPETNGKEFTLDANKVNEFTLGDPSTETMVPVGTPPTAISAEDMKDINRASPVLLKIFDTNGDMSPKETKMKLEEIISLEKTAQQIVDTGRRWNLGQCDRGDKEHDHQIIEDVASKEECKEKSSEMHAYAAQWEPSINGGETVCYYILSKSTVKGVVLEKIEGKDEVYQTECLIIGDPDDEEEQEENPVPNSRTKGFPADAEKAKEILEKAEKLAKESNIGFLYAKDGGVTDQELVDAIHVLTPLKKAADKLLNDSGSEDDGAVTDTESDVTEESQVYDNGEVVETVNSKVTSVTSTETESDPVTHSPAAVVPGEAAEKPAAKKEALGHKHSKNDHDHTGPDDGHDHDHHDDTLDHKHSEDDHDHTGPDDGHDHEHHDENISGEDSSASATPKASALYDENNESSDASRTNVGASMLLAVLLSMML